MNICSIVYMGPGPGEHLFTEHLFTEHLFGLQANICSSNICALHEKIGPGPALSRAKARKRAGAFAL